MSQNERNAALDIGEPISSMRIPPRGERTIIPPSSVHNISDSDCRGTKRELDSTRREIILSILYTIINFFAKKKNRFTKLSSKFLLLFFSRATRRDRQRFYFDFETENLLSRQANFSRAYRRVTRDKE